MLIVSNLFSQAPSWLQSKWNLSKVKLSDFISNSEDRAFEYVSVPDFFIVIIFFRLCKSRFLIIFKKSSLMCDGWTKLTQEEIYVTCWYYHLGKRDVTFKCRLGVQHYEGQSWALAMQYHLSARGLVGLIFKVRDPWSMVQVITWVAYTGCNQNNVTKSLGAIDQIIYYDFGANDSFSRCDI